MQRLHHFTMFTLQSWGKVCKNIFRFFDQPIYKTEGNGNEAGGSKISIGKWQTLIFLPFFEAGPAFELFFPMQKNERGLLNFRTTDSRLPIARLCLTIFSFRVSFNLLIKRKIKFRNCVGGDEAPFNPSVIFSTALFGDI